MSLTRHSRSGKHGRLGHQIGTREMSRGRSLRSIHFIWFLTTWVTVGNSSKCVFVLISMLGRVKNSHYPSCYIFKLQDGRTNLNQTFCGDSDYPRIEFRPNRFRLRPKRSEKSPLPVRSEIRSPPIMRNRTFTVLDSSAGGKKTGHSGYCW